MQNSANQSEEAELNEVNVVPLADVTLVLLIMLMLLSPMAMQSMIQVQSAQAVATRSKPTISEKPIFVDISVDGFTVNNQSIGTEYELFRVLQRNLSSKRDKTVLISSQPEVKYQNVVRILDLVKQSGAVSLSLVPRREEGA
ncbi:MAG: Biopolymer transport protein ExbD [Elusimicrobia bacterium]|nr:Biopolymer transport protein ExbD [Elusimicrobiota bacterium]